MNTVDSLIGAALDVWAKASPLQFYRSSSQQADIMVEFGSKCEEYSSCQIVHVHPVQLLAFNKVL